MTTEKGIVFPADAPLARKYWGTSFWPTGDNMNGEEKKLVMSQVGKWYWQTVRDNPRYAYRLLSEPIVTMVKADYRMNYVFETDWNTLWLAAYALIMKNLGFIFVLASLCSAIIAARDRNGRHLLFIFCCVLYPLLVVLGDGYYEFEKHLFPALFLGIVFTLALACMRLLAPREQEILLRQPQQYAGGRGQENPV
jgi:hypothetical protein